MKKLQTTKVTTADELQKLDLPENLQLSLTNIVESAKEGLLALSVGAGLAVLGELMEEEVTDIVGPKGRHSEDRGAYRHGQTNGEVTLGGRCLGVNRPRVRAADGSGECTLSTYEHFADHAPMDRVVLERMLAGVSTRRYRRTQEPVGSEVEARARSTSKSALSRRFIERTRQAFADLMSRRLDEIELAALMIDGVELDGRTNIVALGIGADGVKVPLGLWEGSTENSAVATALLADLAERGLDTAAPFLVVIDGSKALAKAARAVFGSEVPIQRCIRHKERNVLDHLPERERPWVSLKLRRAWEEADHRRALQSLQALAASFERSYPGAAASLREGMSETVSVNRLGVSGRLKRTLSSTNPIESMFEIVRTTQRNVKRWSSGEMRLRWTAAGMLEAERQFRRVIGYRDLPRLQLAIERELHRDEEVAIVLAA